MKRSIALALALALAACGSGSGTSGPDGGIALLNYKHYSGNLNPSNVVVVDGDLLMAALDDQPAAFQIMAPQAHTWATGQGVVVAVLDGGFCLGPLEMAGALEPFMFDALDLDEDVTDLGNGLDDDGDGIIDNAVGHGTFVAGMVRMAAPEARILAVRVADDEGRTTIDAIVQGLQFALDHGAGVINLSLDADHRKNGAIRQLLTQAKAMGVVVVASAGNDGGDLGVLAASDDTISVGAVDGADVLADFTNEPGQPREVLNLLAPGVDLLGPLGAPMPTSMGVWSGTSFSAGIVSGAAALAKELHPERTPDEIAVVLGGATDPVFDAMGIPVDAPGRINLFLVVTR